MKHVISIHDVVSDTMHQFAPTYHNYVLYSNQGSKEAPKTVSPLSSAAKSLSSMLCVSSERLQMKVLERNAERAAELDCLRDVSYQCTFHTCASKWHPCI